MIINIIWLSWISFNFFIDWLGISICHVFSLSGIITKVNGVFCCIVNWRSDIWLGLVWRWLLTRICRCRCRVSCMDGLIQILCFINIRSVSLVNGRINDSFSSIYGLIRVFLMFSVNWWSGVSLQDWLLYSTLFSQISLSLEVELLDKFLAIATIIGYAKIEIWTQLIVIPASLGTRNVAVGIHGKGRGRA